MSRSDQSTFKSISPSAMSLLETRALTSIPFAREALQLISNDSFTDSKNEEPLPKEVLMRIIHFETRYRSVDKALKEIGSNKIIEFSSGFSFRGLDFCKNPNISYIDTDLPNIIEIKKNLVYELTKRYCDYQPTNLILQPLNVLNEQQFFNTVSSFTSGPLSIVNEGLLMYFNTEQKKQLSAIIHKILSQFGGYWITTEIYR